MFNGRNKALTFSFDDGVTQDVRAIELLDKYGLKATFNLNSGLLGIKNEREHFGVKYRCDTVAKEDVKKIYAGHEVAVHTLTHPNLLELSDEEIARQVEGDRLALEKLVGYGIEIMAYPGGPENSDERVAKAIRERTGVKFARTIKSSGGFGIQDDLMLFKPTVYFTDVDNMFALARKFLSEKAAEPSIFYVWGHTYELDIGKPVTWEKFEEFCKYVSHKEDVFYGTNGEIFGKFFK